MTSTHYPFILAWWSGGSLEGEWKELVGTYSSRFIAESSTIAREVEKMGYTTKVFLLEAVESHGFPSTRA